MLPRRPCSAWTHWCNVSMLMFVICSIVDACHNHSESWFPHLIASISLNRPNRYVGIPFLFRSTFFSDRIFLKPIFNDESMSSTVSPSFVLTHYYCWPILLVNWPLTQSLPHRNIPDSQATPSRISVTNSAKQDGNSDYQFTSSRISPTSAHLPNTTQEYAAQSTPPRSSAREGVAPERDGLSSSASTPITRALRQQISEQQSILRSLDQRLGISFVLSFQTFSQRNCFFWRRLAASQPHDADYCSLWFVTLTITCTYCQHVYLLPVYVCAYWQHVCLLPVILSFASVCTYCQYLLPVCVSIASMCAYCHYVHVSSIFCLSVNQSLFLSPQPSYLQWYTAFFSPRTSVYFGSICDWKMFLSKNSGD